jgi:hypothetical protein
MWKTTQGPQNLCVLLHGHDSLSFMHQELVLGKIIRNAKTMKLGFTGSRYGINWSKRCKLSSIIVEYPYGSTFLHGDCKGADAQAHDIARLAGLKVIIYPPINSHDRAFMDGDEVKAPAPYLQRNRHIVDDCDVLIAAPWSPIEVLRSGTWATVRYARKIGRPIRIV